MIELSSIPLPACLIDVNQRIERYNHAFEEQLASRHWPAIEHVCTSDQLDFRAKSATLNLDGRCYDVLRIPVEEGTKWLCTISPQDAPTAKVAGSASESARRGIRGFREDSEVPGFALNDAFEIVQLNTAARKLMDTVQAPCSGKISPKIARPRELHMLHELSARQNDAELRYSSKIRFGYYEVRLRLLRPAEDVPHIIVRVYELTSKVRVYKRLQECNYRYKTVFQNVRIGLFQTTPKGKLITANPELARMLGYRSAAQLMREVKNMRDLYVNPERRDAIIYHIEKHGFVADVESDICQRDGTVVRLSGTTVGMKDSNNRLIMLQGTIIDTRRYGKQQKVLEILRNTLLKISDSILITDFQHEVIYVNEAFTKLYGYKLEELRQTFGGAGGQEERSRQISWSDTRVTTKEGREISMGVEVRNKGSYSGEHFNYTKEGREIKVSVAASIIQDEFGDPLAYITISRDITRQHEVEKKLRAAKKRAEEADGLKANILSNMSHELRTPLTGIIGFASMLKEMLAGQDEELLYFTDNIKQSGERLLETLNTILMVSDIDSQRVRYNFREVRLRVLVEDSMKRLKNHSGSLHLSVELIEETPEVTAYADYDLLRQAFEKVYKNALKFTEEGSVTIRIGQKDEKQVFVSVADTGVGIPAENLKSIFSPFTQVSSGIARKYQGTGLGLYVCKSYMQLLKGNITVESKKGEGSIFTMILPTGRAAAESMD